MKRIILASKSPRRKQLMDSLNIPYEIVAADIDEKIDYGNDLENEIEKLSFLKALKVFNDNKDAIVIGADTIVVINNEVLGKPKNKDDAKRMLKLLQNNKHYVITGVTILSNDKSESFSNVSEVYFAPLDDLEIEDYLNSNESMDKAGAYAIQGIGSKFIKKINGDYYSIMGFPISEVYTRLKNYL